jgi:hypothetical protein
MRSFLFFLTSYLSVLCVFPLKGQIPELNNTVEFKIVMLYYSNSTGEKAVTRFNYNRYGLLISGEWFMSDSTRSSKITYYYNDNGCLSHKKRIFSDSIIIHEFYDYDSSGKIIKERYENSDGRSGYATFHYSNDGLLLRNNAYGAKGWFNGMIQYREYLQNGKALSADIFSGTDKVGEILYTYDDQGNLKKENWDFLGKWSQTFEYCYYEVPDMVYASSNAYISASGFYDLLSEYYSYADTTGGPSLYFYDDSGKLVKKIFERSDGLKTVTTYLYDKNGLLTSSLRRYNNGLESEFRYSFTDRKVSGREFIRSDSVKGAEHYYYDEKGRLVQAVYNNMDGWLNGEIIFYHNNNDFIVSGNYSGKDQENAHLTFTYDQFDNLTKITWEFDSGIQQIYEFEYRKKYL